MRGEQHVSREVVAHHRFGRIAAALRSQPTPVVCRIQQDRLLFDPRTVPPEQEETLLTALLAVLQ